VKVVIFDFVREQIKMKLGIFDLVEPLPELRNPHIITILQPWIDVGSVGTLTLGTIENQFDSQELGKLARPSNYYDLTRYRPMLYREGGKRIVEPPNSTINYAKGPGDVDFLLLHMMEPHNNGEDLVDSLVDLALKLEVKRYCQIGAMYGSAPHTRPLIVSGQSSEELVQEKLFKAGVKSSTYEGPTSILALVTQELEKNNIDTMSMMVQLPPYARLDEDHRGQQTLLQFITDIYDVSFDELSSIQEEGDRQYQEIDRMAKIEPRVQSLVKQLEEAYDAERGSQPIDIENETTGTEEEPTLSPDVEQFLRELEKNSDDQP
jgi:predicted ATP-grasp superfamily ATP-dependent carboligase|tara:strand:- start:2058 stop:3017 length:960 start_codon:yes stop_codon:yes gene_type:complete